MRIAAVLGALALLAALPGSAAAEEASANLRHSPGESAEFTVAASNGYSLVVKNERHLVTVAVSRGRLPVPAISNGGRLLPAKTGNAAMSTYFVVSSTPPPKTPDTEPGTIDTDFGSLGRIDVTFQPSGRRRVTNIDLSDKTEHCVGAAKVVRRLGTFTGTISFRGENGYTSVDLTSAPGTVGTSPQRNCTTRPNGHQGHAPGPSGPRGFLSLQGKGKNLSLFAGFEGGQADFVSFSAQDLPGSVVVTRVAQARAAGSSFRVSRGGARAALQPPFPFSGSGTYRDPPHGPPTWTGDLSVEFPGLVAPLAGPGFEAPKLRLAGF